MFDVYCERCDRQRLLSTTQIKGLFNDEHGIAVAFECTCGQLGIWRTGRAAAERATDAGAGRLQPA